MMHRRDGQIPEDMGMPNFRTNIIWFLAGVLVGACGMYLYAYHAVSHLLGS